MTILVTRRDLLGGFATFPLIALVSSPPLIAACGGRPPETPLAHLYGQEWVQGAYKLYAQKYADVQTSADASSTEAYRVLAQKGVVALDELQGRDVPFFIKVEQGEKQFAVQRQLPERLTFTADMNDADRKSAEAAWKKAREHVHHDYEEIRRLDWALTRLLAQLQRIRNAIEEGRIEQYRLVDQLADLKKDPTNLPYELPYQVSPKDYEEILLLLLERIEDDKTHLRAIEADIVTVGITVRATDANSATLAASIRKVLLAVVTDGAEKPRPPLFPASNDEKQKLVAAARDLQTKIETSPEFAAWKKEEREKRLAAIGAFLSALDAMTGLPTSRIYRTVLDIWSGERDYFAYLRTVATLVPHGGEVMKVINEALEYTEKARKIGGTVLAVAKTVQSGSAEQLAAQAKAQALGEAKGVVLNTASKFALDRADKQLSYFKDKLEVDKVKDALEQTELVKKAMPALPAPGGG
ncbi:MAG TPA: hypothetical protein VIF62_14915 [Labilithrix sp.]